MAALASGAAYAVGSTLATPLAGYLGAEFGPDVLFQLGILPEGLKKLHDKVGLVPIGLATYAVVSYIDDGPSAKGVVALGSAVALYSYNLRHPVRDAINNLKDQVQEAVGNATVINYDSDVSITQQQAAQGNPFAQAAEDLDDTGPTTSVMSKATGLRSVLRAAAAVSGALRNVGRQRQVDRVQESMTPRGIVEEEPLEETYSAHNQLLDMIAKDSWFAKRRRLAAASGMEEDVSRAVLGYTTKGIPVMVSD